MLIYYFLSLCQNHPNCDSKTEVDYVTPTVLTFSTSLVINWTITDYTAALGWSLVVEGTVDEIQ